MMKSFRYSTDPSLACHQSMAHNLLARTGLTLDGWLERLANSGATTGQEQSAWLKAQGLGLNYAGVIREASGRKARPDHYHAENLVAQIFTGNKAAFLPLYDSILVFSQTLGQPVAVCPRETIIPFYRQHVFAQVKVPNRTHLHPGLALGSDLGLDLGLESGDMQAMSGLINTGGLAKKDRITHRLELANTSEFHDEAKGWFRAAFDRDAPCEQ